jgi:hypothetical protein
MIIPAKALSEYHALRHRDLLASCVATSVWAVVSDAKIAGLQMVVPLPAAGDRTVQRSDSAAGGRGGATGPPAHPLPLVRESLQPQVRLLS